MAEIMESREYTLQEIEDIAEGKQKKRFCFLCEFTPDDYLHEDSAMLKISMPRGFWKMLYGAAKANNCDASEVASDFLGDHIWEIYSKSIQAKISGN